MAKEIVIRIIVPEEAELTIKKAPKQAEKDAVAVSKQPERLEIIEPEKRKKFSFLRKKKE